MSDECPQPSYTNRRNLAPCRVGPAGKRSRRPFNSRCSRSREGGGMRKKVCAQCGRKLPLGVRFKNRWTKDGWKHLRFCSAHCEAINETARLQTVRQDRWIAYLGR